LKNISTFEKLLEIIESDKIKIDRSSGRYSTRVIFLDNFSRFNELINSLKVEKIDLSELLSAPNKWFTADDLINLIQNRKESAVIFPLSEILRFYPENKLQSFLTSIFETQNDKNELSKRIFIPLVGLYEKFSENFWDKFHRQKEGAPVWRLQSNDVHTKVKIFKLNTEIKTNIKLISNNKEWLDYWKSEILTPVINTSSSLNRRWNNFLSDDCFESKILNNIADFLNDIYSLNIKYDYVKHEKEFWGKLLNLYEQKKSDCSMSFVQLLLSHFNINDFETLTVENIFLLYLESDKFEKWLIKLYICSKNISNNYLKKIILECYEYNNLEVISKLYFNILNVKSEISENILQRNCLIEAIYENYASLINELISKFLEKVSDYEGNDSLKYLTGHTFEEQRYIFNSIQNMDEKAKMQIVNTKLSSGAKYLDWSTVTHQYNKSYENWIFEYFEKYNKTKFNNKPSDEFEKLFNKVNKNSDSFFKWYYNFEELPQISDGFVIQIDALGVEWLSYLIYIINKYGKEYNKEITSVSIHRSNLPTITKNNKIINAKYIQDLDLLLHDSKGYKFPDTLIKQLKLIRDIVTNILKIPESKIYLTADHGATCHCLKQFGRIKKYDFENNEHEGRYLQNSANLIENESFIKTNNCYIGLKHDSLNSLPRREVHGGATPEEVLVPLIVIENVENVIVYQFEVINKLIQYNSKKISIKIHPIPKKNPVIAINSTIFSPTLQDGLYVFDVSELSPNKYNGKCIINNQEFSFKFEISGGMKEEDLF